MVSLSCVLRYFWDTDADFNTARDFMPLVVMTSFKFTKDVWYQKVLGHCVTLSVLGICIVMR